MSLPASGPISMSMVRTELQNSGKSSNLQLSFLGSPYGTARDYGYVPQNNSSPYKINIGVSYSSTPRAISAWYSYDHSAQLTCSVDFQTPNITGGNYVYYKTYITGSSGTYTPIYTTLIDADSSVYTARIYNTYPFNNLGVINVDPIYSNTGTGVYWYLFSGTTTATLHFVFWNTSVA